MLGSNIYGKKATKKLRIKIRKTSSSFLNDSPLLSRIFYSVLDKVAQRSNIVKRNMSGDKENGFL